MDRVESLIRNREGDSVTLRLERGPLRGAARSEYDEYEDEDVDTYTFREIFDDDVGDEATQVQGDEPDDSGPGVDAFFDRLYDNSEAGLSDDSDAGME